MKSHTVSGNLVDSVEKLSVSVGIMPVSFYNFLYEKYRVKYQPTEFAILMGVSVNADNTAKQWLSNIEPKQSPRTPDSNGTVGVCSPIRRDVGTMPIIPWNELVLKYPKLSTVSVGGKFLSEFEYPQNLVDANLEKELTEYIAKENVIFTGKNFSVESVSSMREEKNYQQDFTPKVLDEFIYKGRKYIRTKPNEMSEDSLITVNGCQECIDLEKYYFAEVTKLEFTREVDCMGNEYAVPKFVYIGGFQYDTYKENCREERENSYVVNEGEHFINRLLINNISKDILPAAEYLQLKHVSQDEEELLNNPFVDVVCERPGVKPICQKLKTLLVGVISNGLQM